ncbi:GNAT family N-acetyltransferase [Streptomyces sp. PG2]
MSGMNRATGVDGAHGGDSGAAPRIRPRTDEDVENCVAVLARVHACEGYPVDWPDRPAAWLAGPAPLGAWVAELDGRPAGHVGLFRGGEGDAAPGLWSRRHGRSGKPTAPTAVVGRLFVDPGARGHGLGALLLDRAEREAHGRGLHPVLDVVASDTAAIALYERLGWQRMATVEQRWGPLTRVTVHCYAAAPRGRGRDLSAPPDRS